MEKKDIKITGNGFIKSGSYGKIKIMGNTKSEGNISVDIMRIMGNAELNGDIEGGICKVYGDAQIRGSIKLKKLHVNGDCRIIGVCEVEDLIINGDCRVDGNIRCNTIKLRGELSTKQNIYGQLINIYGSVKTDSDISGETIIIKGKINCNGLLNADKIEIVSISNSFCKEIGASSITTRRSKLGIWKYFVYRYGNLNCEILEGDHVVLQNVIAKTVRGKAIELIKQCNIECIEYSDTLNVGNQCIISSQIKV